jgi:hypothetical protein
MCHNGPNMLANVAYGFAHGAHELLAFQPSDYDRLKIEFIYDAELTAKANAISDTKTTITIMSQDNSAKEVKLISSKKHFQFNMAKLAESARLAEARSMFYRDSVRAILRNMFSLTTHVIMTVAQDGESMRRSFISVAIEDGFMIQIAVNDNVNYQIDDKSILDMMIPWLFINNFDLGDMSSDNPNYEDMIHYFTTVLTGYLVNQMHIQAGLIIKTMKISLDLTRKSNNNAEDLQALFSAEVCKGNIMPLSPIQYAFYFGVPVQTE